jgi:C_GCAxxG_C_C family probable redox protein
MKAKPNSEHPVSTAVDEASALFAAGFNCAQSVLGAFASAVGLEKEVALRIATGFGAGMGRQQEVCGALTGAYMVIGCRHGMTDAKDFSTKEVAYARVQKLTAAFAEKHGSIRCRDLLGCDLSTEEGRSVFKNGDMARTWCAGFVRDAAMLVQRQEFDTDNAG